MAATKFDVGGYRLAAEISGEGSPRVVFISGSGDAGDLWDAAISALRSSTTLLTYARAGVGDSETPNLSRLNGASGADIRHMSRVRAQEPHAVILPGLM
jgi:pimeloyl-ACP methyl ester carboxylesterase